MKILILVTAMFLMRSQCMAVSFVGTCSAEHELSDRAQADLVACVQDQPVAAKDENSFKKCHEASDRNLKALLEEQHCKSKMPELLKN
jgi:hypothetical protein